MARGWESKSVEAQQAEAAQPQASGKPRLTREQAERQRQKEILRLSLQNVLRQLELNRDARHAAVLQTARADLERRLQNLS